MILYPIKLKRIVFTFNLLALFFITDSCTVVKTDYSSEDFKDGMLTYYLPQSVLNINATVKVATTYSGKEIINHQLIAQDFTIESENIANRDYLLSLKYASNILMKDDIDYKVNSKGLLVSASLVTEDKTPEIVKQIADTPATILEIGTSPKVEKTDKEELIIITEHSAKFKVLASDLYCMDKLIDWKILLVNQLKIQTPSTKTKNEREAKKPGNNSEKPESNSETVTNNAENDTTSTQEDNTIPAKEKGIAGNFDVVNASFKICIPDKETSKYDFKNIPETKSNDNTVNGILTHPVENVLLEITPENLKIEDSDIQVRTARIKIVDQSRLSMVPVRRTAFGKRTTQLEFEDGVIKSHVLDNPSVAEGFISIPINIAKAIVQIPAQMVQFRYNKISKEVEYETKLQELEALLLEQQKATINKEKELESMNPDSETTKLELEKEQMETQKGILQTQIQILELQKDIDALKNEIKEGSN